MSENQEVVVPLRPKGGNKLSFVHIVASAICLADNLNPDEEFGGKFWFLYERRARFAIQAFRQWTPEMRDKFNAYAQCEGDMDAGMLHMVYEACKEHTHPMLDHLNDRPA